ncbi:MAG: UPF0262 family protein [Alcanivorax sp.]
MQDSPSSTIKSITLTKQNNANTTSLVERDYQIALNDLTEASLFQPTEDKNGPYDLELYIEDNRLVFHISNNMGKDLPYLVLSLSPYRRLIKDYFMIVQSYDEAVRDGKPSRIEAIDMGRRGLHNEGAELLKDRLKEKITLDMDTARRLFTLICVLHTGKTHTMR